MTQQANKGTIGRFIMIILTLGMCILHKKEED